ncbi:MAG: GatB/YqeY domain-containing protein [Longimicrobiales bacterium]
MNQTALKERMRLELNEARKQRDRLRTGVLSMTLSELRNREIELGRDAEDADVVGVVQRAIKRRREAADQMRQGGRGELADQEDREAAILGTFMPPALAESEVRTLVRQAIANGAASIGAVMSAIMPQIKGSFDGREANRIVREELGS